MIVERAKRDQIEHVALRMRERDFAEFSALSFAENREQLAALLAERYAGRNDVLCASLDEPICIGMTVQSRPGVMTLGFIATDRFPEIAVGITRFTRDLLGRYEQAGVHRIEAVSLDGYDWAHRWLKLLGLMPETGPLRGYGRRGEAFVQFARVQDARPSGD